MQNPSQRSRYRGCLLGGAVGDALGAPIEFIRDNDEIRRHFPPDGVTGYVAGAWGTGAITDDTQMTLFTAEGLIRAMVRSHTKGICHVPSVVHHAYLRWLHTQGRRSSHPLFKEPFDGALIREQRLFDQRAPGNTCVRSLMGPEIGKPVANLKGSKGCGGVMRTAPVGLFVSRERVFDLGCEIAAITHDHPSGYLSAGFLSLLIHDLLNGAELDDALDAAEDALRNQPHHEECVELVGLARELAGQAEPGMDTIGRIGEGWKAEEALAIGVYCALVARGDYARGVLLAVNHKGDSDSTGSITGNILGVMLGVEAIPTAWLNDLELSDVIIQVADDLLDVPENPERWWSKYPGW